MFGELFLDRLLLSSFLVLSFSSCVHDMDSRLNSSVSDTPLAAGSAVPLWLGKLCLCTPWSRQLSPDVPFIILYISELSVHRQFSV